MKNEEKVERIRHLMYKDSRKQIIVERPDPEITKPIKKVKTSASNDPSLSNSKVQ